MLEKFPFGPKARGTGGFCPIRNFLKREAMKSGERGLPQVPGVPRNLRRPGAFCFGRPGRTGRGGILEATGLFARGFKHEMDLLDGRLFVDHLRGIKRDLIVRKIQKLTRAGEW